MDLAVFGATGATGRLVTSGALERGHHVVVFARRPEALGIAHASLRIEKGDVGDDAAIARALAGREAVVSSLGSRPWRRDRVCSEGTERIVRAMKGAGVRRLVVVSSVGVAETLAHADVMTRFARATFLSGLLEDKDRMEETIRASGLDWTLIRPVGLTGGRATGKARVADDGTIRGGFVSRADVAQVVLDALARREWIGRALSVG